MTNEQRIARLEDLIAFLAKGILCHEYSKDLDRDYVELVLREIAYNDISSAGCAAKQAKDI